MKTPGIDTALIEKLAELLNRTGLTEIEVAEGEARLRVVRSVQVQAQAPAAPAATAAPAAPEVAESDESAARNAVTAPMVGTVYLSPEPDAAPFVAVGSEVSEGQTLLIIEAMKVMNPIRAQRAGTVREVLVQNAAPVEFGEPLLVIE